MQIIDLKGKTALVTGVADNVGFGWHIAKSLQGSGCMKEFRGIFKDLLRKNPDVKHGSTSMAADVHRECTFNLFVPVDKRSTPTSRWRRSVLAKGANGDIRKRGVWEVYVGSGVDLDRHRTWVLKVVPKALFCQPIRDFPRSRWTNADKCIRQLGLLMNLYGLFQDAYGIWATQHGDVPPPLQSEPPPEYPPPPPIPPHV